MSWPSSAMHAVRHPREMPVEIDRIGFARAIVELEDLADRIDQQAVGFVSELDADRHRPSRRSVRGGKPSRRRMSMAVTMRPRRLSTPAISGAASGTRVKRSGMKTSWTREIGSPNS